MSPQDVGMAMGIAAVGIVSLPGTIAAAVDWNGIDWKGVAAMGAFAASIVGGAYQFVTKPLKERIESLKTKLKEREQELKTQSKEVKELGKELAKSELAQRELTHQMQLEKVAREASSASRERNNEAMSELTRTLAELKQKLPE